MRISTGHYSDNFSDRHWFDKFVAQRIGIIKSSILSNLQLEYALKDPKPPYEELYLLFPYLERLEFYVYLDELIEDELIFIEKLT